MLYHLLLSLSLSPSLFLSFSFSLAQTRPSSSTMVIPTTRGIRISDAVIVKREYREGRGGEEWDTSRDINLGCGAPTNRRLRCLAPQTRRNPARGRKKC